MLDRMIRKMLSAKKGEYRNLPINELRFLVYRINPNRNAHLTRVEDTIENLAGIYCDRSTVELCKRAAILHDITKHLSVEEHVEICNTFQTQTTVPTPKLYHSLTGALLAANIMGEDFVVSRAIFNHTIPREEMSIVDALLMVADNIEPARGYIGVNYIRDLAERDITEAARCYLMYYADITNDRQNLQTNKISKADNRSLVYYIKDSLKYLKR